MGCFVLDYLQCRCMLPSSWPFLTPKQSPSRWVYFRTFHRCSSGKKVAFWDRRNRKNGPAWINNSVVGAARALSAQVEQEPNLSCDYCTGRGWLVCDFCNGQKTNVQVKNNRFYRRCPSCRACSGALHFQMKRMVLWKQAKVQGCSCCNSQAQVHLLWCSGILQGFVSTALTFTVNYASVKIEQLRKSVN